MEIFPLLLISFIIIFCVLLNKVTSKIGMPMLLAFILLGMVFGEDGVFKIAFDDYDFAEKICSVSLVFIIFYGGFGMRWKAAKPVAVKAIVLSTAGVVATSLLTGAFCYFFLHFPLIESFLTGSVIGSTDAASVFYILRSKRLNLKYNTASLLELESGSNDPFSYMLTILFITLLKGTASCGSVIYMVFSQIVYGGFFGVVIALGGIFIYKRLRLSSGFDAAFVLAVSLLSYSASEFVGGNGYLSTYITGIIMGNANIDGKKSLVPFFDGTTGIMQMLIFFLLGLLSNPSKLIPVAIPSLLCALFLTFVARPIAVFFLMGSFKCKLRQMFLISWSGLRGAASIVFAIIAIMSGITLENDLFHITFGIVLFSILLQGTLLPYLSKKLKMLDDKENVLKTFTDYTEETPVQFIKVTVPEKHPWAGNEIRTLTLPPESLLVLINRNGEKIIPRGTTMINAGDTLVLCAGSLAGPNESLVENDLLEIHIDEKHEFYNKTLSTITIDKNTLIVMIMRKGRVLIPTGSTKFNAGDIAVIEQLKQVN